MRLIVLCFLACFAWGKCIAANEEFSLTGEAIFSVRLFEEPALLAGQKSQMGFSEVVLEGFRALSDTQSLLWDLQLGTDGAPYIDPEVFKLKTSSDLLSLSFGIDTLYWAKTEVARLSNIVNQEDFSRGRDIDDQLGRAMVQLSYFSEIGLFDVFYLPHARERRFPDADSRLRTQEPIVGEALYEDSRGAWTPSLAMRYSHWFGPLDLGVYMYHGVAHEPSFLPVPGGLVPFYAIVTHAGTDVQYTFGAFALKNEIRHTWNQSDRNVDQVDVLAVSLGLEYAFYGVTNSDVDLVFIGEYAYDSRKRLAVTPYQDDLILGGRLEWNTISATKIELLYFDDLDFNTSGLSIELTHRMKENLTITLRGQTFFNVDSHDILFGIQGDDNLRLSLTFAF